MTKKGMQIIDNEPEKQGVDDYIKSWFQAIIIQ